MVEFCDPMSGYCELSGGFDVGVGDRNSTPVGTSNMFVKCHGKPENHKSMIIEKLLSVYGKELMLLCKKNWEGLVHFSYLNVRNVGFHHL